MFLRSVCLSAPICIALVGLSSADLVHHYTFDNEDAADRVGDHDGFIEGNPSFVAGQTGLPTDKAIYLNEEGTDFDDDHITFDELEFGDQFSITAWVQPGPDRQTHAIMTLAANTTGGFAGPDGFKWFVNNWNSDPEDGRIVLESHDGVTGSNVSSEPGTLIQDEEWHHVAITFDKDILEVNMYHQGENVFVGSFLDFLDDQVWKIGAFTNNDAGWIGAIDDFGIFNSTLSADEVLDIFENGIAPPEGDPVLFPGDADQNLEFDQLDLVKVQIAAKYLTGQAATWGDGDWNGAPGGKPGSPPAGDGQFNQMDIIAALGPNHYLTGPYAALDPGPGEPGDGQTSLVYDPGSGELSVDAPAGNELTSINITSDGSLFLGDKPPVLDGAFDNFAADNIFKATFGGSFGSISFGQVLAPDLQRDALVADLTVVGSLSGGGDLGPVDLIVVPEPTAILLFLLGIVAISRGSLGRHRNDRS